VYFEVYPRITPFQIGKPQKQPDESGGGKPAQIAKSAVLPGIEYVYRLWFSGYPIRY
jgi:hypothetical protein